MNDGVKQRLLSRKFILAGLAAAMAFVALVMGEIGETTFRDLLLGTIGVYVTGNVAQKATAKQVTS